mmetsp:Transcript_9408/g.18859  ORF Transcript_9408/g.18859 Transcript_9408/m.18859 type:complete len:142 (+) Transcript_9408:120-545(+)|eukprot:CAMPEP_0196726962 /NCGR_PEP_ID=MMETSP1091-20130531/8062_1 /TAXON_ID=302021 /ORGANISM="Rhodomonas sp., Strain CCMP768" /LENGTH=141 /DNA_ID=CAMNT_0042069473 /DNA_START=118 /DNA_END=543 /DNA_ORIENTATION=+
MKAYESIIPTRFMSSMSFLVSTVMVFSTSAENVLASLPKNPSEASFNANETSLYFALAVTILCIAINLFGFMGGFSMFLAGFNVLVVLSHTIGTLYTCVFIMEAWHYLTFWYISVFFAIPVALLEVVIIVGTFCLGGINRV